MAITKTGIIVKELAEAGREYTFEEYGQVAAVAATGLESHTSYEVEAYVIDDGVTITSTNTERFTTMAAGSLTITNQTGTWGTQTKQLTFSCNWSTTYDTVADGSNFKIVTSSDNFATQTIVQAGWQRTTATTGTINGNLTTDIPSGGGSTYYVKVQVTDQYGETMQSPVYTYTVPTQTAGYMAFSPHQQGTYTWWMPSNIYYQQFTYMPATKCMVLTNDNWQTVKRVAQKSWQDNQEMFLQFDSPTLGPNYWTSAIEMEVTDIYGNVFRTNQGYSVKITKPLITVSDTTVGQMFVRCKFNPYLSYTTATCAYQSTDSGGVTGNFSWLPITSVDMYHYVTLPDGDYSVETDIEFDGGNTDTSNTATVTLYNRGQVELTDRSSINNGELQWGASFTSTFPLVSGTVTAYVDDDYYEYIGESAVSVNGTTTGDLYADDVIPGVGDACVVVVRMEDERGNSHTSEYWVPVRE